MEITKYQNTILRRVFAKVGIPVSNVDKTLLNELFAYLKENSNTVVGLSVVQVDVLRRLCDIRFKKNGTNEKLYIDYLK